MYFLLFGYLFTTFEPLRLDWNNCKLTFKMRKSKRTLFGISLKYLDGCGVFH